MCGKTFFPQRLSCESIIIEMHAMSYMSRENGYGDYQCILYMQSSFTCAMQSVNTACRALIFSLRTTKKRHLFRWLIIKGHVNYEMKRDSKNLPSVVVQNFGQHSQKCQYFYLYFCSKCNPFSLCRKNYLQLFGARVIRK